MKERVRFIAACIEGQESMAELCRRFGISRKTGYKMLRRFELEGVGGLADQSRAARTHPNAVPDLVLQAIVSKREAHPSWGPRKIRAALRREHPDMWWPAASTIGALLKRHGLIERRRTRRRIPAYGQPMPDAHAPNERWCIDFKGWFRTRDGARCDPLTISDDHSRFLLVCEAVDKTDTEHVRAVMQRTFATYGMPSRIRSDNGPPFASRGLAALSQLSTWWLKLGIVAERIAPGHPEQNGRHERMHRTLKQETARPPKLNRVLQQAAFDTFREIYNTERPHEALGDTTPASVYMPSTRVAMTETEPEYPEDFEVRPVLGNGTINFHGDSIFVSNALRRELIGLEAVSKRFFNVYFAGFLIGVLDRLSGRVVEAKAEEVAGVHPHPGLSKEEETESRSAEAADCDPVG